MFSKVTKLFTLVVFMLAASFAFSSSTALALGAPNPSVGVTHFGLASKDNVCSTLSKINSEQDCGSGGSVVPKLIGGVLNVLSIIVGILSVIMVVVAGLKFMTSGGDPAKVSSAKTMLVYVVVGIVVVVLSQGIVRFVVNRPESIKPCPSNPNITTGDPNCH